MVLGEATSWKAPTGAALRVEVAAHKHKIGESATEHYVERPPAGEGSVGLADPVVAALSVAKDGF